MGSCVSLHKESQSAMELRLSVGSNNEKLLIPSPVKQQVNGVDHSVAALAAVNSPFPPPRFRDDGSKDEAFFDSQPWLESDCEDDFVSINGDFTPSRGSTPVHHKFSSGSLTLNKAPLAEGPVGSVPQPSPSDKKKRLSELFKESIRREQADDENDTSDESVVLENGGRNEGTPNRVLRVAEKSEKSVQCCLPRLRPSHSISEKKKKASP